MNKFMRLVFPDGRVSVVGINDERFIKEKRPISLTHEIREIRRYIEPKDNIIGICYLDYRRKLLPFLD
jgi:hypothetical protein